MEAFGAQFAYTVDGADFGDIEYENFNAASVVIDIKGVSTHPGEAKDKMKNASLIAMELDGLLPPWGAAPEHTENYEGFYHLISIEGDCGRCQMRYIIREHDFDKFAARKETVRRAADLLNARYGAGTVGVQIKDGYRNMAEMVRPHMHLIEFAKGGHRRMRRRGQRACHPRRHRRLAAVLQRRAVPESGNRNLEPPFRHGDRQHRPHGSMRRDHHQDHRQVCRI